MASVQDILALHDFNSLSMPSLCGLLEKENGSNLPSSQQPPVDDKVERLKSTPLNTWSQLYAQAGKERCAVDLLRAVFALPPHMFQSGAAKRRASTAVFCAALKSLQEGLSSAAAAKDLVAVLTAAADDVAPDDVPLLVEACVAPLLERSGALRTEGPARDGCLAALSVLPRLLGRVSSAKSSDVLHPDASRLVADLSGCTGAQFCERTVRDLCKVTWPVGCQIKVVEVLKDMALGPHLLKMAAHKAMRQLQEVQPDELPALVYQLLLIGAQQQGQEREGLLLAILALFEQREKQRNIDQEGGPLDPSTAATAAAARSIEGNVITLFNFAATQDHDLGLTLLKIIQGTNKLSSGTSSGSDNNSSAATQCFRWLMLTPFSGALALSIMHAQRFEVLVADTLSKLAAGGAKHAHRVTLSAWLEEAHAFAVASPCSTHSAVTMGNSSNSSGSSDGSGLLHASHVPQVLRAVVATSRGWDRLMPALVGFGFSLIDKAPAMAALNMSAAHLGGLSGLCGPFAGANGGNGSVTGGCGSSGAAGGAGSGFVAGGTGPGSNVWRARLGQALLLECFLASSACRETVVTKALQRVVTRAPGSECLLELLGDCAAVRPHDLLALAPHLRDAFGYLAECTPAHAEEFLRCGITLFSVQPSAAEMAALPLRKALFSRDESVRKTAAKGLSLLLEHAPLDPSLLQVGGGVGGGGLGINGCYGGSSNSSGYGSSSGVGGGGGQGLSPDECVALLRRCLTQQASVRAEVYVGVAEVFAAQVHLRPKLLAFATAQFRKYFGRSSARAGQGANSSSNGEQETSRRYASALDMCIVSSPSPHVMEPVGHLIACLAQLLHLKDADASNNSSDGGGDLSQALTQGGTRGLSAAVAEVRTELEDLTTELSEVNLDDFTANSDGSSSSNGGGAIPGAAMWGPAVECRLALLRDALEGCMLAAILLDDSQLGDAHNGIQGKGDTGNPENNSGADNSSGGIEKAAQPPSDATLATVAVLFEKRRQLLCLVDEVAARVPTSTTAKNKKANTGSSSSSSSALTIDGTAVNGASSSSHKPALRVEGFSAAGAASFLDARFLAPLLATLAAHDPDYDDDYGSSSSGGGELKGSDALCGNPALRRFLLKACVAQLLEAEKRGKSKGLVRRAKEARAHERRLLAHALGPSLYRIYKARRDAPARGEGLGGGGGGEADLNNMATTGPPAGTSKEKGFKGKKDCESTAELALQGFQLALGLVAANFTEQDEERTSGFAKSGSIDSSTVVPASSPTSSSSSSSSSTTNAGVSPSAAALEDVGLFVWRCFAPSPDHPRAAKDTASSVISKGAKSLVKHLRDHCDRAHGRNLHTDPNASTGSGVAAFLALEVGSPALFSKLGLGCAKAVLVLVPLLPDAYRASVATKVAELCTEARAPTAALGDALTRSYVVSYGGAGAQSLAPLRELASAIGRELGPSHHPGSPSSPPAAAAGSGNEAPEGKAMQLVRGGGFASAAHVDGDDDDDDDEEGEGLTKREGGAGNGHSKKRAKKANKSGKSGNSSSRAMVMVVADVVVSTLESSLSDVEYVLSIAKRFPKPSATAAAAAQDGAAGDEFLLEGPRNREQQQQQLPAPAEAQVELACARLKAVVAALQPLVKAQMPPGKCLERLFGALRRVYEAVTRALQLLLAHKVKYLGPHAKALLALLAEHFTPSVFGCVQFSLEASQTDRHQLAKQGKLVPLLVERIEQVDQHLVTLAKQCAKTDQVECYIKRTTARDFKINASAYEEARAAGVERLAAKKRKQEASLAIGKKSKGASGNSGLQGAEIDERGEEEKDEEEESDEGESDEGRE